MNRVYKIVGIAPLFVLFCGCAALQKEMISAHTKDIREMIEPALTKAVESLDPTSGQLQGQASAINPGYNMKMQVVYGTCVIVDANVALEGVSGNIAGATQSAATNP